MNDVSELREMMTAMQSGEMTVSRGLELLEMWLAGNYSNDQLPTIRHELPDDMMPWQEIDRLKNALAIIQQDCNSYLERMNLYGKEANRLTEELKIERARLDWLIVRYTGNPPTPMRAWIDGKMLEEKEIKNV